MQLLERVMGTVVSLGNQGGGGESGDDRAARTTRRARGRTRRGGRPGGRRAAPGRRRFSIWARRARSAAWAAARWTSPLRRPRSPVCSSLPTGARGHRRRVRPAAAARRRRPDGLRQGLGGGARPRRRARGGCRLRGQRRRRRGRVRRARAGQPWRVGIRHPRTRTGVATVLDTRAAKTPPSPRRASTSAAHTCATPGRANRRKGLLAATVVGPDLAFADALAKGPARLGRQGARPHRRVARLQRAPGLRRRHAARDARLSVDRALSAGRPPELRLRWGRHGLGVPARHGLGVPAAHSPSGARAQGSRRRAPMKLRMSGARRLERTSGAPRPRGLG